MKYSTNIAMRLISACWALALSGWPAAQAQTTIYVAPGGDDARDGKGSWTNAVRTISKGVALADTAGDLVLVSNDTYDTVATIQINNAITLRGLDRETTIIRGDYPNTTHQGIDINNSGATVRAFYDYRLRFHQCQWRRCAIEWRRIERLPGDRKYGAAGGGEYQRQRFVDGLPGLGQCDVQYLQCRRWRRSVC